MGPFGVPELLILLVIGLCWLVPVGVAIWAMITLFRIRADQQTIAGRLETIERMLRQHPQPQGTPDGRS